MPEVIECSLLRGTPHPTIREFPDRANPAGFSGFGSYGDLGLLAHALPGVPEDA